MKRPENNLPESLRQQAERILKERRRKPRELTYDEALKLIAELEVHQIELELSNEELARTRADLEVAKARLQDLFDFAPVGYMTLDRYNLIREVNITACRMLDVKRDDLLKTRFSRYVDPSSQKEFYRHRRRVLGGAPPQECELVLRRPSGATFHVLMECVLDGSGLRGTITDISARREAENRLRIARETVEFQARMLNATGDAIVTVDPAGHVIYWNDAATSLYGWNAKEAMGRKLTDLIVPPGSEKAAAVIIPRIHTGKSWSGEFTVQDKKGVEFPVEVTDTPVFDEAGRLVGIIGVSRNITERKKTEQLKDEFLGLVSHELRTPLTIISGSLGVAMDDGVSPENIRELVATARESADQLGDILENMLELSRYQAGRIQLHAVRVDIKPVVNSVIRKLQDLGAAQKFEVDIQPDVIYMDADLLRIERVLHNLLENAVKYSPRESGIKVICRVEKGYLEAEVSDEGPGISEEEQRELFQPFHRMGNPFKTKGTGLGLVVSKRLVEAHGGWITVTSAPGKGTTFRFGIPLHQHVADS